jgi:hypothetical protein
MAAHSPDVERLLKGRHLSPGVGASQEENLANEGEKSCRLHRRKRCSKNVIILLLFISPFYDFVIPPWLLLKST